MEKGVLISIIIPVYNVEKYLDRCLESVINQTYKNLEIILVDDGSTDKSSSMCDEWKKKDKRIKVFHKENGGLSSARNTGLKKLKGDYFYFLDSDDTIDYDCIERMYNEALSNKCDIVISPYINVHHGEEKPYFKTIDSKVLSVEDALKEMLLSNIYNVSSCGKLFKNSVLKNIEFPLGKLCEDNGTTYKFILNASKVYYINVPFYKYYINPNSIMTGKFNFKKYDLVELTNQMCEDLSKRYSSLSDACFRRMIYARLSFLRQAFEGINVNMKDNRIIECKTYIKKNFKKIMSCKIIPRRDKIATLLLMLGNSVFKISWKLYMRIR